MADQLIYIDGQWVKKADAKLSVFDHGVLYGDGVFEGIRAYDGYIFKHQEHLERLYRSAELISLTIPMSLEALKAVVEQALKKNNLKDAYIRLLVTRGVGDLGLDPRACPTPSLVVIADKLALYPEKFYKDGLKAIIANTRRNIVEAINPIIKSMNYLNNILAKVEAGQHGVPEAIMLNIKGNVAECTGDNIFLVNGKTLTTPPVSAGSLEGITRGVVISLIKSETSYTVEEKDFKPEKIFSSDEVFFTGTAAEIIPVTMVDQKKIGSGKPGPITQELIAAFKKYAKSQAVLAQS